MEATDMVVASMMFLYLCDRVAYATGEITTDICGTGTQEFPLLATAMTTPDAAWLEGQGIAIPVNSQHAVREEAGPQVAGRNSFLPFHAKMVLLLALWLFNLLWPDTPDS